jgi:hypothetical protein
MKHLEDEDIAKLIDGKTGKEEREIFLKHLSECKQCLTLYSQTLKFTRDDDKLKIPGFEKTFISRFHLYLWEMPREIFAVKKYRTAFAVTVLIILAGFFLLKDRSPVKIPGAVEQTIAENIADIENNPVYSFSGSKKDAAVRIGIMTEDLSLVKNAGTNEKLRAKIADIMENRLKYSSLSPELESTELRDYFRFGCLLERAVLACANNKRPGSGIVGECRRIAVDKRLPARVIKELDKIETAAGIDGIKTIFSNIKKIFLYSN